MPKRGAMAGSHPMSQLSQPRVIVAIPAYNVEQFIAGVVGKAKRFADQVIVIDDGSNDGTARVAGAAGAMIISHGVNKGYGESLKSCFEAAKLKAADALVVLDGDGQHDPDNIPRLLAPIFSGRADVVIGSRFLTGKSNMPRYRKFGIHVITFLCNFGSKVKISDAQSGFRAYSRKAIGALHIREKGMGASIEIVLKLRAKGLKTREVPISCLYHFKGSSLNPVVHGVGVAFVVTKLRLKTIWQRARK
jgi:glycosyltransferase involved in cell wall biosynthesis